MGSDVARRDALVSSRLAAIARARMLFLMHSCFRHDSYHRRQQLLSLAYV